MISLIVRVFYSWEEANGPNLAPTEVEAAASTQGCPPDRELYPQDKRMNQFVAGLFQSCGNTFIRRTQIYIYKLSRSSVVFTGEGVVRKAGTNEKTEGEGEGLDLINHMMYMLFSGMLGKEAFTKSKWASIGDVMVTRFHLKKPSRLSVSKKGHQSQFVILKTLKSYLINCLLSSQF